MDANFGDTVFIASRHKCELSRNAIESVLSSPSLMPESQGNQGPAAVAGLASLN